MKAAQLVGPQRFEFVDAPVPVSKPGEVLVKMEYISVCGSDLRSYDRTLPEEMYPLDVGRPCHECVAVVEESQDPRFKKGQRVIAVTTNGCLFEYASLSPNLLVPVPDDGRDPALWALCQPLGTVIYAAQEMGSVLGKRVLVIGQGPIGLMFTDLIARQGARQVITADLHDYRLDASKQLGATHTVNSSKEDLIERVREITGGEMVDVAVEACGRPQACAEAFAALKLRGKAVIFGMAHTEDVFPFDWAAMYSKAPQITITNSALVGERVGVVGVAVDLVSQGRLDHSFMVTHRYKWPQLNEAFDVYSQKRDGSLKLIINMDGSSPG